MKSKRELIKACRQFLKPIRKLTVSEWADSYRILPKTSAEPGRWRTSRTPYLEEFQNAFTQEGISKVVGMFSAQSGKSEAVNNVIGRYAMLDPCTIMMIQPTLELAEKYSKTRIMPMILDSKDLGKIFSSEKERNSNSTILSKKFTGGYLLMTGANSPANLASQPVRILLCDEVDRFPPETREGDPVNLAAARTTTFWNARIGLISTPTVEGASRIEIEYLAGTQEEWQHKCPNCETFHRMDYRQFICDYDELRNKRRKVILINSVKWRCPDCGFEFDEQTMKSTEQKYIPQNPDALKNGVRSFWVNAFSSPWIGWNDIMREWQEARGDSSREKVIVNTRFSETYHEVGEYSDEREFLERREDYDGEVPLDCKILTAAVDVQGNRLEYEVVGWSEGFTRWGIRRGVILGKPTDFQTWNNLDIILDKVYTKSNGAGLKISRTFIDSGYSTNTVYEYCRNNLYKGRYAIKGRSQAGIPLLYQFGNPKMSGITLVILGVDDGKQEIFSNLSKKPGEEGSYRFPRNDRFFDNRGYDDVYFKQLIAEKKVIKRTSGISRVTFEPIHKHARNESLDIAVYNLAAIKSLNPTFEDIPLDSVPQQNKPRKKLSRSLEVF